MLKKIFTLGTLWIFLIAPTAFAATNCTPDPENIPKNIDLQKVRTTWLSWYNQARAQKKLQPYIYDSQLNRTATIWSEQAKQKGKIEHKRPGQKKYYDYQKITAWFANLGLQFKNIHGVTNTENIAWDFYSCPATAKDCTESLTKAIRHSFDFYMAEKNKKSKAHYLSIMKPEFREIGLGIAIDQVHKKFFLTVHYGTEIISNPAPVCKK